MSKVIGVAYFKDGHKEAIVDIEFLSDTYIKFEAESGTYVYHNYGLEPELDAEEEACHVRYITRKPHIAFEKYVYNPLTGVHVYPACIEYITISKEVVKNDT